VCAGLGRDPPEPGLGYVARSAASPRNDQKQTNRRDGANGKRLHLGSETHRSDPDRNGRHHIDSRKKLFDKATPTETKNLFSMRQQQGQPRFWSFLKA
jgi:hypothetical protein